MPLRTALLGAGRIAGYFHAPLLRRLPESELRVVADADSRRAHLAEGAAFVSDWRLAISDDVDAVVICLPPALHAEAAIAAFEAGKHVYVEKPLALSAEDAARVTDAWRAAGTVGVMGFNFRYQPRFTELRAALGGTSLIGGQAVFTAASRTLPDWKASRAEGGGALRDLGVHHADLLPYLTDRPVTAVLGAEAGPSGEGHIAAVTFVLEGEVAIQGFYALSSGHAENGVDLATDRGHLRARTDDPLPPRWRRPAGRLARLTRTAEAARQFAPAALMHSPGGEPSFASALSDFVRSAAANTQPSLAADIEAGERALRVVLAAEESARTGRRVDVSAR